MGRAAETAGRVLTMFALAGLTLVACTEAPSPPTAAVIVPPPPVPVPAPPLPSHKPAPAIVATLPPPPQPVPPPDRFESLHGLDQGQTVALLGEPVQRTDAPPAILWRYQSRHCELDVYFYLDLETREMRVLHYEVRDQDAGAEPAQRQCYRELVTDRRGDPAGRTDRPR